MMKKNSQRSLFVFILSILFTAKSVFALNDAAVKVKWGYKGNTGPAYWGRLDKSFALCASGKAQSPINLHKQVKTADDSLVIHYQPAPMIIAEDSQTDLTIGGRKTIINDGHGVQLNFPNSKAHESITFAGKKYRLLQFHFHSPSENQLHGRASPLEIHFVHQNDDGELAVIGVFVKGGAPNKTLATIVAKLPQEKGKAYTIAGEQIDPGNLLPSRHNYYSFKGSLTVPPCTEGVQWIVMDEAITATPAQIVRLRQAAGGANARPVQPRNKRRILYHVTH